MNLKRSLLAFLILIVVVGFFYVYEIRVKREKQKKEEAEHVLYGFQGQEITGLTFSFQGKIMEISKLDDLWIITKPVHYPADTQVVEKFINSLNRTAIVELIETDDNLSQYQLDPPPLKVTPNSIDQGAWPTLSLGSKAPLDEGYFASLEGKDAVLILSREIEPLINASFFSIRDKNLLPYSKWEISALKIKSEKGEVAFQKDAGVWNFYQPGKIPAREDIISLILNTLESTSIERFVDEDPSDLHLYQLSIPNQSISFRRNLEEPWYGIHLGKAEGGLVFARRSDRLPVFLISDQVLSTFIRPVEEFKERRISQRNRYSVKKINVKMDGNECEAARSEEGEWRDLTSETTIYPEGEVYSLLASILELRALDFLDLEQWQLLEKKMSDPIIIAEIMGDQFQEEIIFFKYYKDNIYAKNSAQPSSIYKISPDDLVKVRQAFHKFCASQ